jgi:hypothetical protein
MFEEEGRNSQHLYGASCRAGENLTDTSSSIWLCHSSVVVVNTSSGRSRHMMLQLSFGTQIAKIVIIIT